MTREFCDFCRKDISTWRQQNECSLKITLGNWNTILQRNNLKLCTNCTNALEKECKSLIEYIHSRERNARKSNVDF